MHGKTTPNTKQSNLPDLNTIHEAQTGHNRLPSTNSVTTVIRLLYGSVPKVLHTIITAFLIEVPEGIHEVLRWFGIGLGIPNYGLPVQVPRSIEDIPRILHMHDESKLVYHLYMTKDYIAMGSQTYKVAPPILNQSPTD